MHDGVRAAHCDTTERAAPAPRAREIIVYLISLALLMWPLAVNRAPFYSADSASYLRGGAFGFDTGLLFLQNWWQSIVATAPAVTAGGDPKAVVADAIAEAGGIRSVFYSVATYLLRGPGNSLLALAIVQAAAVMFLVSWLRRLIAPQLGLGPSLVVGAGLAFLTSAPWYAAYAVPDIPAGITIAGALALTLFFDRIGVAMRLTLVALIAFCITTHGGNLPIGLSVLIAGAIANFALQRPPWILATRQTLWFLSPLVLAAAALLGTSYVAFGDTSLAPKRYPIQLARSVSDGPGAWYLRDHCATQRYAICEIFGTNPPRRVGDFLWSKNGVRYRATPEQMERIRAEESTIVRRAAMEYPFHQLSRSAINIVLQFVDFGTDDLVFGDRMVGEMNDPSVVHAHPDNHVLKTVSEVLIYLSFAASVALLFALRRQLRSVEIAAISVTMVGLLANAAVCGILSAVTDRYQGRVAWILPALALIIWLRVRADAGPAATASKVTPA
jgi:hypothetical protein